MLQGLFTSVRFLSQSETFCSSWQIEILSTPWTSAFCGRINCMYVYTYTHAHIHIHIDTHIYIYLYLQFSNQLLKIALGGFLVEDLKDLLADIADLAGLGVACGLGLLVGLSLGKSNSENS